jgi:hypothetical protein
VPAQDFAGGGAYDFVDGARACHRVSLPEDFCQCPGPADLDGSRRPGNGTDLVLDNVPRRNDRAFPVGLPRRRQRLIRHLRVSGPMTADRNGVGGMDRHARLGDVEDCGRSTALLWDGSPGVPPVSPVPARVGTSFRKFGQTHPGTT